MKLGLNNLCLEFNGDMYENILLGYTTTTSYAEVNLAIQGEFINKIT